MADHSLITPLPIDVSSLDPDDYTASLTRAAIKSGLLSFLAFCTIKSNKQHMVKAPLFQRNPPHSLWMGSATVSILH